MFSVGQGGDQAEDKKGQGRKTKGKKIWTLRKWRKVKKL